ncbi:hypothetical protein [Aquimarina sp. AU474]|uniref:TapB family protein n=1 Tax=Aquimarina sp. AU474 TaxID=2108529 RepID=UPI001359EFA0|nr:hypothetical protein [Aquimarina sp. AU474]
MNYNLLQKITLSIVFLGITLSSQAQQCNAVPFMKKGAILEYTDYNKKGKAQNTTKHETLSISGSNDVLEAVIKATVTDLKKKDPFSTEYKANCNKGLFSIDMLRFFSLDQLAQHDKSNISLKLDGDVLEFPGGMKPGDALNDGTLSIKVNSDSFTLVTLTFKVFNREIVGEESITTPAGTYKCQKVTFDFESKFGILNIKGKGVEWYYNDAVVVRSESYNKKGKMIAYHELTGIQ